MVRMRDFPSGRSPDCRRELHEIPTPDGHHLIITRTQNGACPSGPPVLLVPGLCQNRHFFDLPGRSFVTYLASRGCDVWNAEFRGHGLSRANGSPYATNILDYVRLDIPAILGEVRRISGAEQVLVIGHSLGGAVFYALGHEHRRHIKALATISSPFVFRDAVRARTLSHVYRAALRYTVLGHLHPHHFSLDQIGRVISRNLWYFDSHLGGIPFQIWYPGSIEREVLSRFIESSFDRTGLGVLEGMMEWVITERLVDPFLEVESPLGLGQLPFPVLFVGGDRDQLVSPADIRGAFEAAMSPLKTVKIFGEPTSPHHWGHCDIILGDHAPQEVWPYFARWLAEEAARPSRQSITHAAS